MFKVFQLKTIPYVYGFVSKKRPIRAAHSRMPYTASTPPPPPPPRLNTTYKSTEKLLMEKKKKIFSSNT